MAIRVALQHRTTYRFDRRVNLSPHEIRLRPAPHCRTPILGYSLNVAPDSYFLNWQQDPYGNWVARLVFTERRPTLLDIVVDLTADMTVTNPFDFFVEPYAEYASVRLRAGAREGADPVPRDVEAPGRGSRHGVERFRATIQSAARRRVDMLVRLNQQLQSEIKYLVRMEPGVQAPDDTLERGCGSCRDSGWLLVQILRQLGIAARFASGYLDPARRRREAARRTGRVRSRFHRSSRVGGVLPARRRLDRTRPDVGTPRRRRASAARLHRGSGQRGARDRLHRSVQRGLLVHDGRHARARGSARDQAVQRRAVDGDRRSRHARRRAISRSTTCG